MRHPEWGSDNNGNDDNSNDSNDDSDEEKFYDCNIGSEIKKCSLLEKKVK